MMAKFSLFIHPSGADISKILVYDTPLLWNILKKSSEPVSVLLSVPRTTDN